MKSTTAGENVAEGSTISEEIGAFTYNKCDESGKPGDKHFVGPDGISFNAAMGACKQGFWPSAHSLLHAMLTRPFGCSAMILRGANCN